MSYIGINPDENIEPFITKKPDISYPQSVLKEIHLITFNKNGMATPFGSYTYRIQKYPGDVDLLETFTECCNIGDVISKFEKSLKNIVKKIISLDNHYFSEFKAGIDDRYDVDIGQISNGLYIPNPDLLGITTNLFSKGLFDDNEMGIIQIILSENKQLGGDEYDVIKFIYRERKILRWTADDILKGYIKLPGNAKITLTEALAMKSPVKIDVISLINGRFVEVTNFVSLAYKIDGELVPVNLEFSLENKAQLLEVAKKQLPEEIEKLYYSDMNYGPFKMIKRMYALARQLHDKFVLEQVLPFISSNTSLLYQIKSEIDTIILVIERARQIPYNIINNQLDEMKGRIASVIEVEKNDVYTISAIIDLAIKENNEYKIDSLKQLKKIIVGYINYETINYLNIINFNPPPRNYLPPMLKYATIIRTPEDNPINPLKKYEEIFGGCDMYPFCKI